MIVQTIESGQPSPTELLAGHIDRILAQYEKVYYTEVDTKEIELLRRHIDRWRRNPGDLVVADPQVRTEKVTRYSPYSTVRVAEFALVDSEADPSNPRLVVRTRTPAGLNIPEVQIQAELAQQSPNEDVLIHGFNNVRRAVQKKPDALRPSIDVSLTTRRIKLYDRRIVTEYGEDIARARIVWDQGKMTTRVYGHQGKHNGEIVYSLQDKDGISPGMPPIEIFARMRNGIIQQARSGR
jgi:hypothetical protein